MRISSTIAQKEVQKFFSDTGAALEELVCDIAQAEALVEISRVGIFSRCKWKGMP
jgi:galactitol-specific phosphotransferase system IIB component